MKSNFSTRLKELRIDNGFTQVTLADALGISKSTISMYELGHREPDFETLEVLADFFNVDMNYLLGLDVPKNRFQEEKDMIRVADMTYQLSPDEERVLLDFSTLSEEGKSELLKHIELLKKVYKKEE